MITASKAARVMFACGLAGWIANALILLVSRYPLGHDEAQYALAARDWLAGDELRWFYASYGMNPLAAPGVLAGGGELALRLVPFVFGIGFVLACGWVARRAFGETTAAWTVLVIACSRSYTRLSVELLSDVPAATCLLAATAVIVGELDRPEGARWRLVLAATVVVCGTLPALRELHPDRDLVRGRSGRGLAHDRAPARSRDRDRRGVRAVVRTARGDGDARAGIAFRDPRGQSGGSGTNLSIRRPRHLPHVEPVQAVRHFASAPDHCCAGRGASRPPRAAADGHWLPRHRALGLASIGLGRYILYATALLTIAGTEGVRRWIASRPPRARAALVAAALAACAIVGGFGIVRSLQHRDLRVAGTRNTMEAAAAIRADAGGVACHVAGVPYAQLEWYGGCSSRVFSLPDALARREPVYVVSATGAEFAQLPGRHRAVLDIPGVVHVVRLDAESAGPGR